MTTVLVVCTANVCRSPMAEVLLRRAAEQRLGERVGTVTVASAGLDALEGAPAARGSVAAMRRAGIELEGHRARRADDDLVDAADLVLTMEADQVARLVAGRPDRFERVLSIGELVDLAAAHGGRRDQPLGDWLAQLAQSRSASEVLSRTDRDVADPIGRSRAAFRRCAVELAEHCEAVADALWGPSPE